MASIYYESSSNYTELMNFHNALKTLEKEKGLVIYGILENTSKDIPNTYDGLLNLYKEEYSGRKEELIQRTISDFSFASWDFTELVTSLDLIIEGSKQSHCVGGYSYAIRSGRSKILSLTSKNKEEKDYTIELRKFRNDNEYFITQCMSKFNVAADKKLIDVFAKKISENSKIIVLTEAERSETIRDEEINDLAIPF